MKLHHIAIQNFLGARAIDLPLDRPVTLIAAHNGAGKSSLRDAISLALTADLCRVSKKGDAASLVSEGAASAQVLVQTDERDYQVIISKAGKITDSAAGTEPHHALPYVLDPARFARLADTERRAFLFGLLGIETSHTAVGERLTRRGCDEQKIAAVLPVLRAGFASGEKHAKEMASQARGAWKAVTGEAYGSQKAEGWQPAAVDVAGDPAKKAEHARAQVEECDVQIASLQQQVGAARAARQAYDAELARRAHLRQQADMIDRIRARLATAEENVEACRAQLAECDGKSGLVHELAYALDRSLTSLTVPFGNMDDSQRDMLRDANAVLERYTTAHGAPIAPANADPARAEEVRRGLQVAESGAANARRDLAAAEAASAELAGLNELTPPADASALDEQIRELTAKRDAWRADERKYREAAGAAERRQQQTADAARHHADVQQWSAIAEALSPDGIQAEMIAEALTPLNDCLAEHAALAQWQPVRIGADMAITVGGRLYALCSESERWRADAMLAMTIAVLSGLRFIVLDRLDVLDTTGRADALYWLSDVAEAGQIDNAIVLATLKGLPSEDALPGHIACHWIERGTLVVANSTEQRREAA